MSTLDPDDLPDLDAMFPEGIRHDVQDCPRCEGEHIGLRFKPFNSASEASHWALCPTSGEPVLLEVMLS